MPINLGSRLYLIRDAEVKFAEKNGFKPFVHCAHPRTGAAHAVLDVAGKDAKGKICKRVKISENKLQNS